MHLMTWTKSLSEKYHERKIAGKITGKPNGFLKDHRMFVPVAMPSRMMITGWWTR